MNTLYVLYKAPPKDIPHDAAILSFMQPADEYIFSDKFPNILYGRKEMEGIRQKALRAYMDLIASIGATSCGGKTLRQVLEVEIEATFGGIIK